MHEWCRIKWCRVLGNGEGTGEGEHSFRTTGLRMES